MGAPKASHGDREGESIVPRPRSPFVPFQMCEASVTFSFDLEDLVVSTQIVFLNFSSLSGQTPKFNPRSKVGGTHPTSIAQRASAHLLERERYISRTDQNPTSVVCAGTRNAPSARLFWTLNTQGDEALTIHAEGRRGNDVAEHVMLTSPSVPHVASRFPSSDVC